MSIKKGKVQVEKDKVIIAEGSAQTNQLFNLVSGTAIAEVKGKVVGTIKSGEWFGEMAALLGAGRTATVRAVTNCEVMIFKGVNDRELIEALERDPKLMEKLIQTLATRLVESSRRNMDAVESTEGLIKRYGKAISGTLFALDKVCEKYKSKVMQEVKEHLAGESGIPMGKFDDVNLDYFKTSKGVVEA